MSKKKRYEDGTRPQSLKITGICLVLVAVLALVGFLKKDEFLMSVGLLATGMVAIVFILTLLQGDHPMWVRFQDQEEEKQVEDDLNDGHCR